MGLESPTARAERLARLVATWDRVQTVDETISRIDAVDLDALRAFAEKVAGKSEPALALLGPVAQAPDRAELARRLAA
jgi:predicted Zn-dependent peptidase